MLRPRPPPARTSLQDSVQAPPVVALLLTPAPAWPAVFRAEDEESYDQDEDRDTVASLADRRRRDDAEDQAEDTVQMHDDVEIEADYDEEEEGGVDDEDDEDITDDQDVDIRSRNRQYAINIEHPFGLPIWKPALYKKSRSVTRNAEIALHSIPSAAAERQPSPGKTSLTILFGSWLSLICYVSSILINFIPLGGSRYARVAWELGGYLFWPFGKYVEVEVGLTALTVWLVPTTMSTRALRAVDRELLHPRRSAFPHDHAQCGAIQFAPRVDAFNAPR